jgi:ribose 5-phosphate isomerase
MELNTGRRLCRVVADRSKVWAQIGATHIPVNTMRAGVSSPQRHIGAIQQSGESVKG